MWYDRLIDDAKDIEVELVTNCSVLFSISYNSAFDANSALQWWSASLGPYTTMKPTSITDENDIRALLQLCRRVLNISQCRTIKSTRAFVLATSETANFNLLTVSVVLNANEFLKIKRTRSVVERYDELGGTEFI